MKVVLVNGSPHRDGCTNRALQEMTRIFAEEGIDARIFWIGNKPMSGCLACWHCEEHGECVFGDKVCEFHKTTDDADG